MCYYKNEKGIFMYSEFGKYLRILRLNNGELLKTMADKLNVSSAFLSSIETGKKNIPSNFKDKIIKIYNLSKQEINELNIAINNSKLSEKINLQNNSAKNVGVALQFARRFNEKTLSDKTLNEILKLLNAEKEG